MYQLTRPSNSFLARNFCTTSAITKKTYAKFREKYEENVIAFQKQLGRKSKFAAQVKRSTQKAYVHPYEDTYKSINPGPLKILEAQTEFMGAQQVSPHYEHFSFARRSALTFWAGLLLFRYLASVEDLYIFAKTAFGSWAFLFAYSYYFSQGRKFFMMPMLNRFYRRIALMQMGNLDTYYKQNAEGRVRNLMSIARSQIQYKMVHNDYVSIRNNLLLNFLINEQVSLKNHIYERANNILKQVEQIEDVNKDKIISNVMSQTLKSIDIAYELNKQQIKADMFKLALEGIANGKMDYSKDSILPYVLKNINQTVDKFSRISIDEQNKLICLSQEQLQSVRNSDALRREQFLQNQPKIDGSLRENPTINKIIDRWGK